MQSFRKPKDVAILLTEDKSYSIDAFNHTCVFYLRRLFSEHHARRGCHVEIVVGRFRLLTSRLGNLRVHTLPECLLVPFDLLCSFKSLFKAKPRLLTSSLSKWSPTKGTHLFVSMFVRMSV